MRTIIVTGSAGLIRSKMVKRFGRDGVRVVGIDSDVRAQFFGPDASMQKTRDGFDRERSRLWASTYSEVSGALPALEISLRLREIFNEIYCAMFRTVTG